MKNIRRISSMILVCLLTLCLAACGSSVRADDQYTGKYNAVTGEAMGLTLSGDDISGFSMELKEKGKGTITVNSDTGSCKWTNDDTTLTLTVEGTEMVGDIGQDILTFDDMLGSGMKITFAKEGTDAARPENYLPDADKNMLGVWKSEKVTDVLGNDASDETAPDGLTVEFFSDHTAAATLGDTNLGKGKWYIWGDSGYFEEEYTLRMWSGEGSEIELNYSDGDHYWVFTCTKQ